MPEKRERTAPEGDEARRGEHNELHYYNADEEQSYDERGSQTQGAGESERDEDDE
jgi:hypothetical protein